jgi:hypothetical protein
MSHAGSLVHTSIVVTLLLATAPAAAHIDMTSPEMRPAAGQKDEPCGDAGGVRSDTVNVFEPGETITVEWTETISHPGYYRISFDADGQDFTIPPALEDTSLDENVLVDLIEDIQPGQNSYTQEITLPDIECENCTLQLIQVMSDKLPYTTDAASDDIYFRCADIALRTGGVPGVDAGVPGRDATPPGNDAGGTPAEPGRVGGCQASNSSAGGGAAALTLLAVVGLRTTARRRRRTRR